MSEQVIATELQAAVIAEIERQARGESLQALIAKKVEEVIVGSINDAFRSWGDVGKQIDKAVKDSLQISDRLEIPAYGVMVMAVLRQKLDERVHTLIADRLDAEMNEILSIAPRELKFSAVVEALRKQVEKDRASRYGTSFTCIVDQNENYNWYEVGLDEQERVARRDCVVQFTLSSEGSILSCRLDGKDPKTSIRMGGMWGYQKMIFGAYCCGSKIIMDELEPSTGIGDY